MKKKSVRVLGILLLLSFIWYLFIKPDDYIITFKAETSPGTVYYLVKDWNLIKGNENTSINTISNIPYKKIKQEIIDGDTKFIFRWQFTANKKSNTNIKVGISQINGSFIDRLLIPFKEILPARFGKEKLRNFQKKLIGHLQDFKVSVDGESVFGGGFYAYVTIKSSLKNKAEKMIFKNSEITTFLAAQKIKIAGNPILEVTDWNQEEDIITFNFCFPIDKNNGFPDHSEIKFKELPAKKALKATFNGNYRISDRAWFALDIYRKQNNISVEKQLIEVFYNNPNHGGDELKWKAEIFMPLKNP